MGAQYVFGFLEQKLEFSNDRFEVRPTNSFDKAVELVRNAPTTGPKWFYPPVSHSPTEKISLPAAIYRLPSTHLLITESRPYVPAYGEFLVLVLGFLLGQRLTIEGTGHLRPTPWKSGELVSFVASNGEILACLEKATVFWDAQGDDIRKLMFGAIHWFLVAQSYDLQYERFNWAYTVLDNLHRIAWHVSPAYKVRVPNVKGGHSERPKALADVFGSPLPAVFADQAKTAGNVDRLVAMRNELVHEARWAGEPLGYAVSESGDDLIDHLVYFCSQIILGLLDVDCRFRKVNYPHQTGSLDIIP